MTEGNRATHVQSFAKTVTDLTLELLHFDVGTIHLHDYDARRANLCYATGIPDIAVEAIRNIPLDGSAYARVLVRENLFLSTVTRRCACLMPLNWDLSLSLWCRCIAMISV